jgi:hypothetical protein
MAAIATTTRTSTVYGLVLGEQVKALAEVVRRFHAAPGDVRGQGLFRMEGSPTALGRLLATLMRLPRATGDTPVGLTIIRLTPPLGGEPRELWHRQFGPDAMDSIQVAEERLVERFGRLELGFDLTVADARLLFTHVRTRVRIGRLRLRLPRWLSPHVEASVGATIDRRRLAVSVRINAPLVGDLLSYGGELTAVGLP